MTNEWWRSAVMYQIYPRSWADSDGDGIGDLRGITDRLDHLAWLGVDGIWLNPIMPSPNEDWGYDVSDYCDVHLELGTLDDLDALVARATELDLRVLLDLVPNHTSDRHPWFIDSSSSRDSRFRDWYVWADPGPDGGPPNNWVSVFGIESAWTFDEDSGQYYLHNFLPTQPDLNWWNDEVRAEFDRILRFWYERGIAGFRIDVAHALMKDRELRDNPPATEDDPPQFQFLGQRVVHNMNRPETHDILKAWRGLSDEQSPPRVLVGETYVFDLEQLATFYGDGDELNLGFNFPFVFSAFEPDAMTEVVGETVRRLPRDGAPVWFGSNHDVGRFPTRWCNNDPHTIRCALFALLMLPGTTFLYYGDEIGMPATDLEPEDLRDPVAERVWPGRDPARTPMQWDASAGAGFTTANVTPWLPLGDPATCNVAGQKADPGSILNLCRDLIAVRREHDDLRAAPYEEVDAGAEVWAWRRGEWLVIVNVSGEPATVAASGSIACCTDRSRDGEVVEDMVEVGEVQALLVSAAGLAPGNRPAAASA